MRVAQFFDLWIFTWQERMIGSRWNWGNESCRIGFWFVQSCQCQAKRFKWDRLRCDVIGNYESMTRAICRWPITRSVLEPRVGGCLSLGVLRLRWVRERFWLWPYLSHFYCSIGLSSIPSHSHFLSGRALSCDFPWTIDCRRPVQIVHSLVLQVGRVSTSPLQNVVQYNLTIVSREKIVIIISSSLYSLDISRTNPVHWPIVIFQK